MRAALRVVLFGSLLCASALVYACVGDDPSSGTPGTTPDEAGTPTGMNDSGVQTNPTDSGGNNKTDSGNGAACDGGITCSTKCVDSMTDGTNCGRCSHDCGKGKCGGGVCQPAFIAGEADGGAIVTSVTTDQTDDNPKGAAQRVFWSVTGVGGGIFQDNVIGGNTLTLSTGASAAAKTNVVVSGTSAYWFAQNFGGAPQPVLKAQVNTAASQTSVGSFNANFIQSIAFDTVGGNVLGSYAASSTTHGAFRCVGSTCTSLTTFSGTPGGNVAMDGTNLYFSDPDNGLVLRTTLNGGSVGTYVQAQATPNLLRVDGTSVYWNNSGTKTIQRGPLTMANTAKQMASTTNAVDALAADAVNVYWTDSVTGNINYAPITGAGPNTPYVTTLGPSSSPMRMVRDSGFLYFSHNAGIYRVALP